MATKAPKIRTPISRWSNLFLSLLCGAGVIFGVFLLHYQMMPKNEVKRTVEVIGTDSTGFVTDQSMATIQARVTSDQTLAAVAKELNAVERWDWTENLTSAITFLRGVVSTQRIGDSRLFDVTIQMNDGVEAVSVIKSVTTHGLKADADSGYKLQTGDVVGGKATQEDMDTAPPLGDYSDFVLKKPFFGLTPLLWGGIAAAIIFIFLNASTASGRKKFLYRVQHG